MSLLAERTKPIVVYSQKHQLPERTLKNLGQLFFAARSQRLDFLQHDSLAIAKDTLQQVLSPEAFKQIRHPFSSSRPELEGLCEQIGFRFSDTNMNLIQHFRHQIQFLHHAYTLKLFMEGPLTEQPLQRLQQAEQRSALYLQHSLNIYSQQRSWVEWKLPFHQILALNLEPLIIRPKALDAQVQQDLGLAGVISLMEFNTHLFKLLVSAGRHA